MGEEGDWGNRLTRLYPVGTQLPKTRSGKIMRRILRKIAANEISDLGDTSTLAEAAVVEDLIKNRLAAVQK